MRTELPEYVLFGKTRLALLQAFFADPDAAYYLREVASMIQASPGTVKREVDRLVAAGLLERNVQGTQIRYRANARSPIFPEIRGIVVKTSAFPERLREALLPLAASIKVAFIYGSTAGGEATPESDVDLFIVGDISLRAVVRALADVQQRIGREVNPSVYSVGEFEQKWAAHDPFLADVVRGSKLYLLGDEHELGQLCTG